MNSSRFGGFRTADGASQGSKAQYSQYNQMGGQDQPYGNDHGP